MPPTRECSFPLKSPLYVNGWGKVAGAFCDIVLYEVLYSVTDRGLFESSIDDPTPYRNVSLDQGVFFVPFGSHQGCHFGVGFMLG